MEVDQGLETALARLNAGRSRSHMLGLVTATLVGGRFSGSVSKVRSTVSFSYASALVALRVGRSPLRSSTASLPSGQFTAHSSSMIACKSSVGVTITPSIGQSKVNLPEWSPSVFVRFVTSLNTAFVPLAAHWNAYQQSSARWRSQFFDDVLQMCCDLPAVADPLSQTQLSFMVNSGRPQALRADPSLAIFTRMRAAVRRSIQPTSNSSDPPLESAGWKQAMERRIAASLVQLSERALIDLHPDDVQDSFVYQQLFASEEGSAPNFVPFPLLLQINSQRITINLGSSAENRNQLELGPGHLRLQVAERVLMKPLPLSVTKSSTSLLPTPERPTFHVILTGSLAMFRITLHPSLLSVIEGVLRLKREIANNSPTKPAMKKSVSKNEPIASRVVVVETFLDVERFEIRALAQVLSVGMRLKGGHLTGSLILGSGFAIHDARGHKSTSISVLTGYREFSVQARSTQDDLDSTHPDRAVLAALTLLDAELFVATDLEDLRATATLNSLKLKVPRSALKFYTFIKQWEAEYLPCVYYLSSPSPRKLTDALSGHITLCSERCSRRLTILCLNLAKIRSHSLFGLLTSRRSLT